MTQRWCFQRDDSGHNYLIPAEESEWFHKELEKDWDDPDYQFDDLFGRYRCDSTSNYTFENPKEDA
jgi:hypothetical protein